jgi:hypothetical protein
MIRLIQFKALQYLGKDTLNLDGWKSDAAAERMQESLRGWTADALPGGYCRLTQRDDDLQYSERLWRQRHAQDPRRNELKRLKTGFDKATYIYSAIPKHLEIISQTAFVK